MGTSHQRFHVGVLIGYGGSFPSVGSSSVAVGDLVPVSWTNVKVTAILNALSDIRDKLFWEKGPDFDRLHEEKDSKKKFRTK